MEKLKLMSLGLALTMAFFSLGASAQITTPIPSPEGSASSKVGLTDIEINYFRPQIKGRKIFGSGDSYLVPFGKLWRAGANQGTKVKFSDDVKVGGKDLAAGEYLLLATPGKSEWTIDFYGDLTLGGNMAGYDASQSIAKVSVKPTRLSEEVNTLTYQITDISEDSQSANIQLAWENTSVKVPVIVSFDEEIMASIKETLGSNARDYLTAANYYLAAGKDMEQALVWIDLYLSQGENSKQFWNLHTKAKILAEMGNKKEAKQTAQKSMELAKAFPQGDFGYVKRNQDLIDSL